MQRGLLVLVVFPVVAENSQCVGDTLSGVLHLELDRVLTVVHLLMVLVHLNHQDALLSIWLLSIDRKNHIISNESFLWLLARLIEDAQVVPDFPKFVLQGSCLSDVLK